MSLTGVDEEIVAAVFEQELTTATARGDGLTVARHDRDGPQSTAALASEVAHERTLRAKSKAVARVLHVGAHDDTAVGGDRTGAHGHV
jgi:hypothetical protein